MAEKREINPFLRQLLELGPPIVFFVIYLRLRDQTFTISGTEYSGFIVATILLRRALGIEPWHALAYEITAAALAVGMLLLERGLNARESGLLVPESNLDVPSNHSQNEP